MNNTPFLNLQGLLLIFTLLTLGCAQQHSVQVHDDSVSFYYNDAKAKEIFFASSTDHFTYHPATKGSGDVWQVTIPLSKEFSYFYIVDGKVTVPDCPNTVLDDFGTKNCLYVSVM
ncbi:MAG: hypothetical protein PHZ02_14365 [Desulfocapsaceae bacterium]|nr:hypothetical protein [Desulfocapsaceae bacterium]